MAHLALRTPALQIPITLCGHTPDTNGSRLRVRENIHSPKGTWRHWSHLATATATKLSEGMHVLGKGGIEETLSAAGKASRDLR